MLVTGCLAALAAGFTLPDGHPVFALAAMGWVYGPLGAFLPELFPAKYRYSASSFAYNLGGVLGGALAPTVATYLVAAHGARAVGWYVAAAAAVSVACVLLPPETYKARSRPTSVRL
ncbi:hypothetical protein ACQPW3_02145 [Actinosynnema sp. CA-248983]